MIIVDAARNAGRPLAVLVASAALAGTGGLPAGARPAPDLRTTAEATHRAAVSDSLPEFRLCFMGRSNWNTAAYGSQEFCASPAVHVTRATSGTETLS